MHFACIVTCVRGIVIEHPSDVFSINFETGHAYGQTLFSQGGIFIISAPLKKEWCPTISQLLGVLVSIHP